MIGGAVNFVARGSPVAGHQIDPVDVPVHFQVIELIASRVLRDANRVRPAARGVQEKADLKICIEHERRRSNAPNTANEQPQYCDRTKDGFERHKFGKSCWLTPAGSRWV